MLAAADVYIGPISTPSPENAAGQPGSPIAPTPAGATSSGNTGVCATGEYPSTSTNALSATARVALIRALAGCVWGALEAGAAAAAACAIGRLMFRTR